jgi:Uma2 family endonuclease
MKQTTGIVPTVGTQRYRLPAADYIRIALTCGFSDAHVELVEGELVRMAPSGMDHGRRSTEIAANLRELYRPFGYEVVTDVIVELSDDTVRAPDISVVDSDVGEREHLLAPDILLAVEIANATLHEDLGRKRIDYATAGIRNYWVVDLAGRRVHCFSDPQGADYATVGAIPFGDPLPVPGASRTITIA